MTNMDLKWKQDILLLLTLFVIDSCDNFSFGDNVIIFLLFVCLFIFFKSCLHFLLLSLSGAFLLLFVCLFVYLFWLSPLFYLGIFPEINFQKKIDDENNSFWNLSLSVFCCCCFHHFRRNPKLMMIIVQRNYLLFFPSTNYNEFCIKMMQSQPTMCNFLLVVVVASPLFSARTKNRQKLHFWKKISKNVPNHHQQMATHSMQNWK